MDKNNVTILKEPNYVGDLVNSMKFYERVIEKYYMEIKDEESIGADSNKYDC